MNLFDYNLDKIYKGCITKEEVRLLDIKIVSTNFRFIENQSVVIEIDGERFMVNTYGHFFPEEIKDVDGVIYGLYCNNCNQYGYHNSDIPYIPHLYQQKALFKRLMELFPENSYTVNENFMTHEKYYKIIFDKTKRITNECSNTD